MSDLIPLRRGQWARLRDGRLLRADHLPGDSWLAWWDSVPEDTFGGECWEGRYKSTQASKLSEVVAVYNNLGDAKGWPKARGAEVVE